MRALRAVLIGLLVAIVSGTAPAVATYAMRERARPCDTMCARCTCKRSVSGEHLRGPCPCCQPQRGIQAATLLPPAVLPDPSPAIGPPPFGPAPASASLGASTVDPSVAHPPPKRLLVC